MTGATVLSRALQSKGGDLPPEGARFILDLGIMEDDKKRMLELLAKQQAGPNHRPREGGARVVRPGG